jgi:hypothetical protein
MVRALLDGKKTQTRRLISPQPDGPYVTCDPGDHKWYVDGGSWISACPHGIRSDRLWVRETWLEFDADHQPPRTAYRADMTDLGEEFRQAYIRSGRPYRWRPSIHMPRWASRITLEVEGVRIERLQQISETDARAEGTDALRGHFSEADIVLAARNMDQGISDPRPLFGLLWERLHGKKAPWQSNPWVWVVTFHRCEEKA